MCRGYNLADYWNQGFINQAPHGHLIHELGHSFGLYHSFSSSKCEKFQEGSSNNYMDYGNWENLVAFTECQIYGMHKNLTGESWHYGSDIHDAVLENCFIQNESIASDMNYNCGNIYAGTNVTTSKPQGNVVIKNGTCVIFEAENETLLHNGFKVELGAEFEVK